MSASPRTFCPFTENLEAAAMVICFLPTCGLGFGRPDRMVFGALSVWTCYSVVSLYRVSVRREKKSLF